MITWICNGLFKIYVILYTKENLREDSELLIIYIIL